MDFNVNRGSQPATPARATASTGGGATSPPKGNGNGSNKSVSWRSSPTWLRVVWIILLFSATALVVSILALIYFGGPKEANYVDDTKKQAVFLTNGQVYFGSINDINKDYIDLRGIYYLNVNQQVQPDQKEADSKDTKTTTEDKDATQQNSISLVKLGCELHGPADQMVINRDQVTFWENLKDDGQVAKAIDQWIKENPEGQKCS